MSIRGSKTKTFAKISRLASVGSKQRFEEFGTAGNASGIRPPPPPEKATRYKSGSLDPKFG